jgi:hypothetical protein
MCWLGIFFSQVSDNNMTDLDQLVIMLFIGISPLPKHHKLVPLAEHRGNSSKHFACVRYRRPFNAKGAYISKHVLAFKVETNVVTFGGAKLFNPLTRPFFPHFYYIQVGPCLRLWEVSAMLSN